MLSITHTRADGCLCSALLPLFRWSFVSVNPGFVLGPPLTKRPSETITAVVKMVTGGFGPFYPVRRPLVGFGVRESPVVVPASERACDGTHCCVKMLCSVFD